MMKLRPYQMAAVAAVRDAFRRHRSTLVVMPTGTGKTVTFGQVARHAVTAGRKVLVLAHREELLDQAERSLRLFDLRTGVEMAEHRVERLDRTDVVLASVPSLQGQRLAGYDPDAFGLVVVDEAHHAAAPSYRAILDHFASSYVLGVTATPDRADGVGLQGVFEQVAFSYEIRDAIQDGWLVPIRARRIVVEALDLDAVKLKGGKRSDYQDGALAEQMQREAVLHGVAAPIVELAGDRPTLVFCASVEHARALADVIDRYAGAGAAVAIDGTAPREVRTDVVDRFREGRIRFLCNCALFLEGFDAPPTACVAMARPTRSRGLYTQAVGRGTRLHPGKEDLLILDFVGAAEDFSLCCPADVLEGRPLEDAERRRVAKVMDEDDELGVLEALDRADELARAEITVEARWQAFDVDPFRALGISRPRDPDDAPRATQRQLNTYAIQSLGIDCRGLSQREASRLIDEVIERTRLGLCTYRQARLLAKHGINPTGIDRGEAGRLITAIRDHGWRAPSELRASVKRMEEAG